MKLDLSFEEFLPHPVEAVWAQLTDAAAIDSWLMQTDGFVPAVGTRFRLKTAHLSDDGWIVAEVVELDPPRQMAWTWTASDGLPSTVTFTLKPDGVGTRLAITHVGEADQAVAAILRDGWPGRIDLIRRSL